jgi:hypothetical protein
VHGAREGVAFDDAKTGLRLLGQPFGEGKVGPARVMAGIESDVIRRLNDFPDVTDANVRKLGGHLIERLVIAVMVKPQFSLDLRHLTNLSLCAVDQQQCAAVRYRLGQPSDVLLETLEGHCAAELKFFAEPFQESWMEAVLTQFAPVT